METPPAKTGETLPKIFPGTVHTQWVRYCVVVRIIWQTLVSVCDRDHRRDGGARHPPYKANR